MRADGLELPDWAQIIQHFGGQLGAKPKDDDEWHVFTMPSTRMASGILAAGYLVERLDSKEFSLRRSVDTLTEGDQITWLTQDLKSLKHGRFSGITEANNDSSKRIFSYLCSQQGPISRDAAFFDLFRFSPFFGTPFVNPRPLSRNASFVESIAPGRLIDLTTQSKSEICLVGDIRTREDLLANELSCGGTIGCLDDFLRVDGLDDAGESPHYLSLYANPSSRSLTDIETDLVVYDGSHALRRKRSYVKAAVSVVFLDRWDIHAREVFTDFKGMITRRRGVATKFPSEMKLPMGVEYIGWVSPK